MGLEAALAAADHDGDDNLIKLQGGQYLMASNFLLSYDAVTEHHDLTIEGGYGPTVGDDCGVPPTSADARVTVLDQGLWRLHMAGGAGSITLKSMTIQNTFSSDATHAPVEIGADVSSTGDIDVENVKFLVNGSTVTPGVYLIAAQGAAIVKNAVFAENTSFGSASAVRIGSLRTGSFCTLLINSTFTQNASSLSALNVMTPACSAIVANDIFWGNNIGADVDFADIQDAYLFADDFHDPTEAAGAHTSALLSVDPIFMPDLSLSDFSPLRDRGFSGGAIFDVGAFDVDGRPRSYYGVLPDVGAFEIQDVIFADAFDTPDP
jgi:hypothetical protein